MPFTAFLGVWIRTVVALFFDQELRITQLCIEFEMVSPDLQQNWMALGFILGVRFYGYFFTQIMNFQK